MRVTAKRIALFVVAYGVFAAFGQIRWVVAPIVSGRMTLTEASVAAGEVGGNVWLAPEHSELAGSFITLLEATYDKQPLLLGESYFGPLIVPVPKALLPVDKPPAEADLFSDRIHAKYLNSRGEVAGWGYNPVAEAYINFGVFGVVIISACWTVFFIWMGRLRAGGASAVCLYAVMVPQALNANRSGFRGVYLETLFCCIAMCCSILIARLVCRTSTLSEVTSGYCKAGQRG
jgi:hypothetical protein